MLEEGDQTSPSENNHCRSDILCILGRSTDAMLIFYSAVDSHDVAPFSSPRNPHGGRLMSTRSATSALPPHASPTEAMCIVLVCFGWFIVVSLQQISSWRPGSASGFTNSGFDALLLIELIMGAAAMLVLWACRYPLHMLYPQPSWRGVFDGVVLCVCAIVADDLVAPLLPKYATAPIDEMAAATKVSWSSTVPTMIVNGAYEEVFLLGYLMRGLRRYGASTALGIALFVRMLYHTYQGPVGVVLVAITGLVFGLYLQRKGQLFPVVLAHIAIDLIAFL